MSLSTKERTTSLQTLRVFLHSYSYLTSGDKYEVALPCKIKVWVPKFYLKKAEDATIFRTLLTQLEEDGTYVVLDSSLTCVDSS